MPAEAKNGTGVIGNCDPLPGVDARDRAPVLHKSKQYTLNC